MFSHPHPWLFLRVGSGKQPVSLVFLLLCHLFLSITKAFQTSHQSGQTGGWPALKVHTKLLFSPEPFQIRLISSLSPDHSTHSYLSMFKQSVQLNKLCPSHFVDTTLLGGVGMGLNSVEKDNSAWSQSGLSVDLYRALNAALRTQYTLLNVLCMGGSDDQPISKSCPFQLQLNLRKADL